MKILALSQDISLLNIIDYILYKDYKIVKSTSFENLDVELSSFDLLIIDLPYWENNPNINKVLKGYNNIPVIILTEDKSSSLLTTLKSDFYVKSVLKEPLSKKDLKESVKELIKKKKNKKDKDKSDSKSDNKSENKSDNKPDNNYSSPAAELVNNSNVVFFRITDLQDKRIEFISDNYKNVLGISENLGNLKDLAEESEIPFISNTSPDYFLVYKLKNSSSFKIVKEEGKGVFDSNKYLLNAEGTITDYTESYLKQNLFQFVKETVTAAVPSEETSEFIRKTIHSFSQNIPKELVQLSINFLNKDYFANDFLTTDFLTVSDIIIDEKKQGEVLLFSLNNDFDDVLQTFAKILADLILLHSENYKSSSKKSEELLKLKQDLSLTSGRLSQAEAAFKDKASSFDNLNELFSSAMKDFKIISSKLNRTAVIFETNSEGKFLSANENYYRAVASDRAGLAGKYFDDIFENTNWQNFQFEFFNNSNQEITLKQKNKEGKSFYFSFHIAREESDNGYKFVFYGKDKTEAKTLEIELGKQISEYNFKVTELIDAKKSNELLWEEMNSLKEELKQKDETIKKQEKKILRAEEEKEKISAERKQIVTGQEYKEYKLDKPEAEIIFREDVEQKIEEAKEEIEKTEFEPEEENEGVFKNLRGIDSAAGLKNAYDNIDTYNEILVNFENDYSDFIKDIKEMYLVNDTEYIKSRLLTLSEESKYIGAEDLEKSAHLFHDKINENKVTNFDFELSVLGVHLSFTLDSIRKYKTEFSLADSSLDPLIQEKPEEVQSEINSELKNEVSSEVDYELNNKFDDDVFDTIKEELTKEGDDKQVSEPEFSITLAPEKKEKYEQIIHEIVSEEIIKENKSIDEIQKEINKEVFTQESAVIQKPDDAFTLLLKDMKRSLELGDNISSLKEKMFKLKFENSNFSRIERLESLEQNIEMGNNSGAIKILDELIS